MLENCILVNYTLKINLLKQFRSQQRVEELVRCKTFYQNLMENPTSEMFYKLIKKSKSKKESNTTCLVVKAA